MASSASSSSSATTGSTSSSSITHGVNPSLLLLSNMASMVTVKLDYYNYMVWRHQIEVILVAYSMINFINDDDHALDPFCKDSLQLKLIQSFFNGRVVSKPCLLSLIQLSLPQSWILQ